MYEKILNLIASVNYRYEKLARYFQHHFLLEREHPWQWIPEKLYMICLRQSTREAEGMTDLLDELEKNIGSYFNEQGKKNCSMLSRLTWEFPEKEQECIRISDRYVEDENKVSQLNIYIISMYLFLNEESLLKENMLKDENDLKWIFHMIFYPDQILDYDIGNKEASTLKYTVKEQEDLLEKYFVFVEKILSREFDESWEIVMGNDKKNIRQLISKKLQAVKIPDTEHTGKKETHDDMFKNLTKKNKENDGIDKKTGGQEDV